MDENKNHINRKLSEQLPSHSPDKATWQRLSDKLDFLDSETAFRERLQGLPVHSPDHGTWNLIYTRLYRIAYYKTGIRIALAVAAGLLLFFTVSRFTDQYQSTPNKVPQIAMQKKPANLSVISSPANPGKSQENGMPNPNQHSGKIPSEYTLFAKSAGNQETLAHKSASEITPVSIDVIAGSAVAHKSLPVETGSEKSLSGNENLRFLPAIGNDILVKTENNTDFVIQNTPNQDSSSQANEIISSETSPKSILFQKEQYATTASLSKNSTPVDLKPVSNKNHFAIAADYLPENIYNGTNNSLFHNIDFTASYNKEKVRYNTSIGMAYNEEQMEFNVSYNINTLVTAFGQGGKLDTLGYNTTNMNSAYTGTEKHQYFTYNLGMGRQIISSGKFSTWLNLGAGFGVLLNNPDLVATTAITVKNQYNAKSVSINSSNPVYNEVNVNFITAIDFNYKIISRLSITFTPTSRWYVKPVLSVDNQATDKLTLGFRTGMKFDF